MTTTVRTASSTKYAHSERSGLRGLDCRLAGLVCNGDIMCPEPCTKTLTTDLALTCDALHNDGLALILRPHYVDAVIDRPILRAAVHVILRRRPL